MKIERKGIIEKIAKMYLYKKQYIKDSLHRPLKKKMIFGLFMTKRAGEQRPDEAFLKFKNEQLVVKENGRVIIMR